MPAPSTTTSNVIPRPQILIGKALAAVERFRHIEAVSGIVLVLAAVAALLWANSSTSLSYDGFWRIRVALSFGSFSIGQYHHSLANDGLMTIFFLVVGMEIRQEIQDGALSNTKMTILPLEAALVDVLVPAGVYLHTT